LPSRPGASSGSAKRFVLLVREAEGTRLALYASGNAKRSFASTQSRCVSGLRLAPHLPRPRRTSRPPCLSGSGSLPLEYRPSFSRRRSFARPDVRLKLRSRQAMSPRVQPEGG
jgi:hypothetical protein